MNIIDICIIVLIAAVAVLSARRGFLMSLFNIAAYILSGIFSKILSSPVSEYIYTNYISEKVRLEISSIMPAAMSGEELMTSVDDIMSVFPNSVIAIAKQFGIYPDAASLSALAEKYEAFTPEVVEQRFVAPFVTGVISVLAALALFIVLIIVLKIVFHIVNKILTKKKHTLIRKSNMFLGAALGVVKGTVLAAVVGFTLNIIAPVLNNAALTDLTTSSYLCGLMADIIK